MTDLPKCVFCGTTLTFLALRNLLPEQTLNADESMIPNFGQHGAKQYIQCKPIKFGYTTVNFTWLCHQFLPMSWSWNHRQRARSWGSVVHSLLNDLPMQQGSSYYINLFTNPQMLYLHPDNGMAALFVKTVLKGLRWKVSRHWRRNPVDHTFCVGQESWSVLDLLGWQQSSHCCINICRCSAALQSCFFMLQAWLVCYIATD